MYQLDAGLIRKSKVMDCDAISTYLGRGVFGISNRMADTQPTLGSALLPSFWPESWGWKTKSGARKAMAWCPSKVERTGDQWSIEMRSMATTILQNRIHRKPVGLIVGEGNFFSFLLALSAHHLSQSAFPTE